MLGEAVLGEAAQREAVQREAVQHEAAFNLDRLRGNRWPKFAMSSGGVGREISL
jgi:hypothetical protein